MENWTIPAIKPRGQINSLAILKQRSFQRHERRLNASAYLKLRTKEGFLYTTENADPKSVMTGIVSILERAIELERTKDRWRDLEESILKALEMCKAYPNENVAKSIPSLAVAAAPMVSSLRSSIAKAAIALFQVLFEHFGRQLDSRTLQTITTALIRRAGGSGGAASGQFKETFLSEAADTALCRMVDCTGGHKAVDALLACLPSASSTLKVARHLDGWVFRHYSAKTVPLSVTDKIEKAAKLCILDKNSESRAAGKRILQRLNSRQ